MTDGERSIQAGLLAFQGAMQRANATDPSRMRSTSAEYEREAVRAAIRASRSGDLSDAERDELARLRALINTPQTKDWFASVDVEAAHQIERWSASADAGKSPPDWFWLLGFLAGKAVAAFIQGNRDKGLHHIISSSAALLNWHRHVTGENQRMRPGIAPSPAHAPINYVADN